MLNLSFGSTCYPGIRSREVKEWSNRLHSRDFGWTEGICGLILASSLGVGDSLPLPQDRFPETLFQITLTQVACRPESHQSPWSLLESHTPLPFFSAINSRFPNYILCLFLVFQHWMSQGGKGEGGWWDGGCWDTPAHHMRFSGLFVWLLWDRVSLLHGWFSVYQACLEPSDLFASVSWVLGIMA